MRFMQGPDRLQEGAWIVRGCVENRFFLGGSYDFNSAAYGKDALRSGEGL